MSNMYENLANLLLDTFQNNWGHQKIPLWKIPRCLPQIPCFGFRLAEKPTQTQGIIKFEECTFLKIFFPLTSTPVFLSPLILPKNPLHHVKKYAVCCQIQ